jgi:AbrB family looped-hinge helix DNA binding protein
MAEAARLNQRLVHCALSPAPASTASAEPRYLAVETSKIFPGEVQDLWSKLIKLSLALWSPRDRLRRYPILLTGKSITGKSNTKVRITSKGQVTIPQELRERFGLLPNTEVEFVATPDGKELRLMKSSKPSGRGRALVERMRGRGAGKLSTDELLKLMRSDV